jgi:hypothetical protein
MSGSWTATRRGKYIDLAGPVGDTLAIAITSTSSAFDWTGWTWTGQVRQKSGSTVVATFTFTDTSTSGALNVVAKIADTSVFTAHDELVYGIKGSKGGDSYTFLPGVITPEPQLVA